MEISPSNLWGLSNTWIDHWGNFTSHQLVAGLEHVLFVRILGRVIPTDFHIFQRGGSTTNQPWYVRNITKKGRCLGASDPQRRVIELADRTRQVQHNEELRQLRSQARWVTGPHEPGKGTSLVDVGYVGIVESGGSVLKLQKTYKVEWQFLYIPIQGRAPKLT